MTGLTGQFDLAWALADLHLSALTEDDFLWEPAPLVWTVRPDADGRWRPDWAETEPDPIPVPTIGWLSWHLTWWWSVASAHLAGDAPPDREDILWRGPEAVVAELRRLADEWRTLLTNLSMADLQSPAPFPWPPEAGRSVEDMALWAHVELTKNVAEIGMLRLLRAAGR
ncbi:DinB family protein [Mycolicibacterium sp. F2034L]|uniref:DinB family protein n=1 Tax=Mycolicibacterium sp. F2034L TaxID=2926422 RepID=UPI001FF673E2|nr:DinB family protein [Mycolicibacterium sp. F2034L]MCK0174390.1 DinB family protein [Mycolicibacterium sp. F2034L]